MKKILNIILISLLLATFILPSTYSCAIEKSFFEISKSGVSKNEKIEMIINLSQIKYNKFLFELKANSDIENIEISKNETTSNTEKITDGVNKITYAGIEVEKSGNEITIEIDKETNNLDTLVLYYQVPQNLNVNDKIKFVATITNLDNSETDNENQIEAETQTVETEIKIVESTNNSQNENSNQDGNTNPSGNNNQHDKNNQNSNGQNPNQSQNNIMQNKNTNNLQGTEQKNTEQNNNVNTKNTVSNVGTVSKTTEQTVTYNGSDNNYLSGLSVNGYTLNKEFSKENSTYFITVEKDVSSLEIIANADDEASLVCIYGNEELSEGTSKILISVTAENGKVRNYRIYVTKNS